MTETTERLTLPVLPTGAAAESPPPPRPEPKLGVTSTTPMPDGIEKKLLEGQIVAAISKVYDPEIPVNVYELGLIYSVEIFDDRSVKVLMTLTAPGCPVAGSLPAEVGRQVESVADVRECEVVLVWEPAWDKSRMSEAALLTLGF